MAAPPLQMERRDGGSDKSVANKDALGRRDVRQSHRENAECRLSAAPFADCRLPLTARSHRAEARCGDWLSSVIVLRRGAMRRRTTGRSSVLPPSTAFCRHADPSSCKPNDRFRWEIGADRLAADHADARLPRATWWTLSRPVVGLQPTGCCGRESNP